MYVINKLISHSAVDYAAEELRKYLRMMMPECGNIEIRYAPDAKDGFRLGLMQQLGLDTSDAEDTELDDILYIDTDMNGGVIAGDNPRSVLLSVYEYFRQNGCRWLFPGVDGEFIPMQDIKPVKYRHKPTSRYRGLCNEGSEFQSGMVDCIEFLPKVGMNVFMMEFFIPTSYYRRYYNHKYNEKNRPPEPVTNETILQWKRACETELSKRGLQFHDIGHGWTAQPFGIDTSVRSEDGDNDSKLTPDQRSRLALVKGERKLWNQTPNHTQFCMSNDESRRIVVDAIADYAEKNSNIDYLHVWLGDGVNNQCECEACAKKSAPDWYVIMLNELDEELTRRKLNNRIVFIVYGDTTWSPDKEVIKNQKRFTCLFAPISRDFSKALAFSPFETLPYKRNENQLPRTFDGVFGYFNDWRKTWGGASISYDYHFWRHQYYDLGGIERSKIINKDIKFYYENGVSGVIEDGSQRSFFPTGLAFYTYARTLFDCTLTFDEIAEDYMSCAFGDDWKKFYDYLEKLGEIFNYEYLEGRAPGDASRSQYYSIERAEALKDLSKNTDIGRKLVADHYNSDFRIRTYSVRLLEFHILYAELFADAIIAKAVGDDDTADKLYAKMAEETGKFELAFQACYDHGLVYYSLDKIFSTRTRNTEPIIY